jgi:RND family efflux transporter MFP subunit
MDVGYPVPEGAAAASRRVPRGLLIGVVIVVLLVGAALVRQFAGGGAPKALVVVPLVSVLQPGRTDIVDTVTFTGTISARDELPIGIEGEGGRISAVLVEVGDRVQRGQLLARLDASVADPQVGSLAAALEDARANAALAAGDARRAAAVASVGALSAEEIERRRSVALSAEAKVRVAAAQLAEARARLRRMEIRAPAEGIVLTRTAEVGQSAVGGNEPLFRLGRGGAIEMRGQVPEQDLPPLRIGQPAKVRVTGLDDAFAGTVRLIGAVIDTQSRLGSIRIDLAPNPALRPGAFARGEIEIGRARLPVVPQTAIMSDAAGSFVYLVGPDDQVVRRDVQVSGTRSDGVVIRSGLDGSERVVSTAAAYLRLGEKVRTVAAPALAGKS